MGGFNVKDFFCRGDRAFGHDHLEIGKLALYIPLGYPILDIRSGYTKEIIMTRTTVFQSNRSQAVRLPKDVAFPEGVKEVTVLREGKRRVIVPSRSEEHTSELTSLMRI